MSESKHTPGPWRAVGTFVIAENGPDICSTGSVNNLPLQEAMKNATLIAAAPALLEACKAQHEAMDMLFALLISKYEGYLPSKSGKPWEAMLQGNAAIAQAEKER